jgi:hypothetical protein
MESFQLTIGQESGSYGFINGYFAQISGFKRVVANKRHKMNPYPTKYKQFTPIYTLNNEPIG